MKQEKRKRTKRMWVLGIGALYFLIVAAATVYSQTGYLQNLPVAVIGTAEQGVVPNSALVQTPSGVLLNYVEQQDGPWGKQYVLRQKLVFHRQPGDESHIFVSDAMDLEEPIALFVSTEPVYDGMEVCLSEESVEEWDAPIGN